LTQFQDAYAARLRSLVEEVRPVLIAEEDSEEALANRGQMSIAKSLASEFGINHLFCDPTRTQRLAMGYRDGQGLEWDLFVHDNAGLSNREIQLKARAIEIGRYFPMRERFWLERIGNHRDEDIVFVCGDGHVASFCRLLDAEGIRYRVVERGIGLTEADAWFEDAVQYLNDHPEVLNE
jgi:hypothetical protein